MAATSATADPRHMTEMSRVQTLLRQSEVCYLVCMLSSLSRWSLSCFVSNNNDDAAAATWRTFAQATATREVRGGKRVPVILALVASTVRAPEETAVVTLGIRGTGDAVVTTVTQPQQQQQSTGGAPSPSASQGGSWDIRDVVPITTETSLRVVPPLELGGTQLLELRSATGVHLFEAVSHSLSAFVAAVGKAHATARDNGFSSAAGNSHHWVKYYTMRASHNRLCCRVFPTLVPAFLFPTVFFPPWKMLTFSLATVREASGAGGDDMADAMKRRLRLGVGGPDPDVNVTWISKMLKTREGEFTTHKTMTVFFGTWNVNGQDPTVPLEPWLVCMDIKSVLLLSCFFFILIDSLIIKHYMHTHTCTRRPDIYCIGFQELDLSASALVLGNTSHAPPWQSAIQSALKFVGDYVTVCIYIYIFALILLRSTLIFSIFFYSLRQSAPSPLPLSLPHSS